MPQDFNRSVIEEFRANHGRVGGPFAGGRLVLLTTIGARSGARHTTPLGYLPDGARKLVIASAGGAPNNPAWYHNLVARPRVTVEDGVFTYAADAVVLTGDERDRAFARAAEADPGWAAYQAKSGRILPVVALEAVPGPPDLSNPGAALRSIHNAFRRELALVRGEFAASGPTIGAQLRVNCLTLCQGLHGHHTTEDVGLFTAIERQRPDLADTVAVLRAEHRAVQELLAMIQRLVTTDTTDPAAVLPELDRLTSELDTHLSREEDQLIPVLDAMMG